MVQHGSLVNAYKAWEDAYQLRSMRSYLQMASFSFDVFSGDLVRALCSGGKLVLCPRETLLDAQALYGLMQREAVECAEFVPAVLRYLVQYLESSRQRLDLINLLACGSDSWYVEEYKRFQSYCGPQTRLINSFGLSEATIDSTYFESRDVDLAADQLVPIGRPFANTQLYILDRHAQPVPIGVAGELHVGGVGLARGYLNRPELTAEKFIAHPFEMGKRLYKTGDLARYLPSGNVEFLGRMDFQVKIRGFRVELGEIEAVLGQHPHVGQAVVVVREDTPRDQRLVAYVVANGKTPDAQDMRSFLQDKLPNYMIPSAFVVLDAIPLSPNGKTNRRGLPAPDMSRLEAVVAEAAPQSDMEKVIAEVWQMALGIDQIGVYDNFFDLGGHSLMAVQIVATLEEKTGYKLNPLYMRQATLGQMAAKFEEELASPQPAPAPVQAQPAAAEKGLTGKFLKAFKRAISSN
jgi:acyl-coenzyme A synthetase/AMP-(fatty) acid ligase/acyl carrier protein